MHQPDGRLLSSVEPSAVEALLTGKEDAATRVRAFDWSHTPLGPIEAWPCSLVGYVSMVLEMPIPAIIFWGRDQTQIYNSRYAVIMGPRHPRYFASAYGECWPDTAPTVLPWMLRVQEQGEGLRVEETLFTLTRHGFPEEAYFTFTFSPLRGDDGAIAGILQPVLEVTDRVIANRRSQILRALMPSAAPSDTTAALAAAVLSQGEKDVPFSLIYLWDEATDRFELAARSGNLAGCSDLGRIHEAAGRAFRNDTAFMIDDAKDLLGLKHIGPWPESARSAFVVPLRRTASDRPRGAIVFGVSPRLHFDEAYRNFLELAAGHIAAARDRAVLLERESEARRDAELQKDRLATTFAQAPTPICVLRGPDFVIELANEFACRVWGRTREDVIGKPLFEALPELRGQVFKELLDSVLYRGEAYVGTEVLAKLDRRGDGTLDDAYFNFVYAPLRGGNDGVEGVVTIALEVTDQVRARDQLSAASRAKDEFLAMLGHELRNPLAPMQNSLQLIRKKLPASPVQPQIDVFGRQLNNLSHMVNDLLEVSRVTQGLIELRKERVDLARAVAAAMESTRSYLESRHHEVSVSMPMKALHVLADPVRLEQVIVNLLTNAGKYTEPGGRVQVIAERAGDQAEIRICDNGMGISAELQPRIFDLFTQGDRGIARLQGGLGIGLTIVRRLVELHGGTIEARSEGLGKGSEFVVRLPRAAAETATVSTDAEKAAPVAPAMQRRVLVVDDNRDAATSLAMLIDALGHETRTAFDGPAALRVTEEWSPELIILDIGLPGMDGYQVARELRRRDDGNPLVVALTGYGQESDRRKAEEAGFDRHLVKPAPIEAIEDIISSLARLPAPSSRAPGTHP